MIPIRVDSHLWNDAQFQSPVVHEPIVLLDLRSEQPQSVAENFFHCPRGEVGERSGAGLLPQFRINEKWKPRKPARDVKFVWCV